jgi:tRNA A37 methylthiotransferase MiaB
VPVAVARDRNQELREIAAAKKGSFMWEQVGRVVEAITLRSGDDESTEALTDNYLKMKIPGRLESNRWIEVRVQQAGVDVLEGRVA